MHDNVQWSMSESRGTWCMSEQRRHRHHRHHSHHRRLCIKHERVHERRQRQRMWFDSSLPSRSCSPSPSPSLFSAFWILFPVFFFPFFQFLGSDFLVLYCTSVRFVSASTSLLCLSSSLCWQSSFHALTSSIPTSWFYL